MLIQKLDEIIEVLDRLIEMTKEDIKNIKIANHDAIFANTLPKEELAERFFSIKSDIDVILASRNKPIEEIFSKKEEEKFLIFREKLEEFHKLHKKFAKLAFSVANFYNTLVKKIKGGESIDYKENFYDSSLKIKV